MDTHVTMITDLVESRRDCVGFVSPYRSLTVGDLHLLINKECN